MPPLTIATTKIKCTFGTNPGSLVVLPASQAVAVAGPPACAPDGKPMMNVMPFGKCLSLKNPEVAAATAAAAGVLQPQPCVPATPAPWAPPNPTVMIANNPAISINAKLMCNWGGVIMQLAPAQTTVLVPS